MKPGIQREILPLFVLLSFGILTAVLYPSWPDSVPTHFDARGIPNQFSSKSTLVVFFLGMLIVLYGVLTYIPRIDPFWKNIQSKYHILLLLRDFILLFMLFVYILNIIAIRRARKS